MPQTFPHLNLRPLQQDATLEEIRQYLLDLDAFLQQYVVASFADAQSAEERLDDHTKRKDNPHEVTAQQVGAYPVGSKVADSERLNGQPASYYTNIPARLGYTPVNKAGDTMTGELTIQGAKLQRVKVVDFWVDGNADTYYPVVIRGVSHYNYPQRWLQIWRYYSWEAPDTWNTATHKGGLDLKIAFRLTGWGGQEYYLEITHLRTYSYMVADITVASPDTNTLIVWLRGGHARYQFISEDPNLEPEVYIGDYIHMPGTQHERTYSPRTTVEPMWQKNVRILTTLSEVYAGGGYRSPKNAYKVWHAGNHGSGSGLDADLLDGQHGSYYAKASDLNAHKSSGDHDSRYWRKSEFSLSTGASANTVAQRDGNGDLTARVVKPTQYLQLPVLSSDPSSPPNGAIWMRS